MEKPFESSDLKNPILYPVTRVTSNKSWYLKKYQLCRKYFCIRPCIHSPSTRMGGKSKLRKASLPLVMHLKLDFSSTVTRVTLEWLTCKNKLVLKIQKKKCISLKKCSWMLPRQTPCSRWLFESAQNPGLGLIRRGHTQAWLSTFEYKCPPAGGHWPRKGVWGCAALKTPFSRLSCSSQGSHFKQKRQFTRPPFEKIGKF